MSREMKDVFLANDIALRFLESFDFKPLGRTVFNESLVTVSEYGKEIGEMNVSVEETVRGGEICYLVHAHSHGVVDNVPCGTSVTAYVGKGLVTYEQTQHEFMKIPNKPLDKKTLMVKEGSQYFIRRIVNQGGVVTELERSYSSVDLAGFVSEGASIIIQRKMAQEKSIPEDAEFLSLDSHLEICSLTFRNCGTTFMTFQDDKVSTFGIEKLINTSNKSSTLWRTYFLESGHMSHRTAVGSPVSMQIVKLPLDAAKEAEEPSHEEKPLHWQEDMELTSRFTERKKEISDDHSSFVRHQPELKALMSDFLQFLLLRKPDDVCSFAADYFSSFGGKNQAASATATSSSIV